MNRFKFIALCLALLSIVSFSEHLRDREQVNQGAIISSSSTLEEKDGLVVCASIGFIWTIFSIARKVYQVKVSNKNEVSRIIFFIYFVFIFSFFSLSSLSSLSSQLSNKPKHSQYKLTRKKLFFFFFFFSFDSRFYNFVLKNMVDKQLQDYMYQKELIAGIEERAQVILQAVELTRDACLAKQGDGDAVVTGSNFGGVSTVVMQKMKKLGLGSGGGVVVRKAKEMSSAKVVELARGTRVRRVSEAVVAGADGTATVDRAEIRWSGGTGWCSSRFLGAASGAPTLPKYLHDGNNFIALPIICQINKINKDDCNCEDVINHWDVETKKTVTFLKQIDMSPVGTVQRILTKTVEKFFTFGKKSFTDELLSHVEGLQLFVNKVTLTRTRLLEIIFDKKLDQLAKYQQLLFDEV